MIFLYEKKQHKSEMIMQASARGLEPLYDKKITEERREWYEIISLVNLASL